MHKRMQKIEQMPHSFTKKCSAKKLYFKKIFCFIGPSLLQNEFRAGMDMGKRNGCSKKTEKERKKSCLVPLMQFVHMVGVSRTSKTSSSSSSSNSNSSSNIY